MIRVDLREMFEIPLGRILKIIWTDGREVLGTVFGDTLGYEDGTTDDLKVIREAMDNEGCEVYRMN